MGTGWVSIMDLSFLPICLGVALVGLVFLYGNTYMVAAPWVLKRAGRKKLSESYLQFGNILLIEHELNELVTEGNQSARLLMRTINTVKWLFLLLTLLLVVLIGILVMS